MATETSRMNRQVGNYDLLTKIAEGGMGAVYNGRNRSTGEIVAIKIIR
jgi:eukaryotic-like serine/threonine-protein kinase